MNASSIADRNTTMSPNRLLALAPSLSLALLLGIGAPVASAQPATLPVTPAAPAGAALAKAGLWETNATIETAGSNSTRTVVSRACFGADDVTNVQRLTPPQHEFGMQCQNRDAKAQGQTVTWQVTCSGKNGNLAGTGKLMLSGDGYLGVASLESSKPGSKATTKISQRLSGKWIGPCK